jgi:acyl-ACP thioesterase
VGDPRFTELVDASGRGRVFSQSLRPSLADCAPSGRTRLDALARWLQDVAYFDVEEAGLADGAVWVVRRTRMRVSRFPRFAEPQHVSTFCSGLGRMWAERRTSVTALDHGAPGATGVEAVSLWVHLDPRSRRPVPFSQAEIATYSEAANGRRVSARLRHPTPESLAAAKRWLFRATECDVAGHVNNAAYWQPLEEELLLGDREPCTLDVEIEFRSAAQPGEKLIVCERNRRWIVAPDGDVHATIVIRGEDFDGRDPRHGVTGAGAPA